MRRLQPRLFGSAIRGLVAVLALPLLATSACAAPPELRVPQCAGSDAYTLVIHGGTVDEKHSEAFAKPYLDLIEGILIKRGRQLSEGAKAIEVVELAVRDLEDSGLLNAGKFATANQAGFVETDASIMDGRTQDAGAVASMLTIKNPISAARLMMTDSPHLMMVGDRGEAYLKTLGAETVAADYFSNNAPGATSEGLHTSEPPHGTVGAVALDRCGNLAAATSTGGFGSKIPGRVGDSPIIGASTYAENGVVAVSSTGHGEYFIRFAVAHSIRARIAYLHETAQKAADTLIHETLKPRGAEGGVIAVTPEGEIVMSYNSVGMLRGAVSDTVPAFVAVYGLN